MPAAYMLSDVVVSASTDPEGFGRVITEAQAMGRPVVATDHGGARETIVPGVTGWLAPPRDPVALADAITAALRLDAGERAAFARRAIAHVAANYTREAMCGKTIDVYEELLFPEPATAPSRAPRPAELGRPRSGGGQRSPSSRCHAPWLQLTPERCIIPCRSVAADRPEQPSLEDGAHQRRRIFPEDFRDLRFYCWQAFP